MAAAGEPKGRAPDARVSRDGDRRVARLLPQAARCRLAMADRILGDARSSVEVLHERRPN